MRGKKETMVRRGLAGATMAVLALSACAKSADVSVETSFSSASNRSAASSVPPKTESRRAPRGSLLRSQVKRAVSEGLGAFLQRVELDANPVRVAGKFRGFRVVKLKGEPGFWEGVDLQPNDVVTKVNGRSIERPEDSYEAFKSLDTAPELRVDYERNGSPRLFRMPIVEDAPR